MPTEKVEVQFDYEYKTSEGKHVSIHRGDVYKLLAKSTEEWWKVRRGDRDKFYVPANYVKVVESSSPPGDKLRVTHGPLSIKTDIPDSLPNGHGPDDDSYQTDSGHGTLTPSTSPDADSADDRLNSDEALYVNSPMSNLDVHSSGSTPSEESPTTTITPEGYEEPEYANLQIVQDIISQRKEGGGGSSGNDAGLWEMHTDDDTGQAYYYNSVTDETTWNSPVIKKKSLPRIPDQNKQEQTNSSPHRVSRVSSFRKGWTEAVADTGTRTYVHNATGEKWHMAVDSSGKTYYYKENSQESLWELPQIKSDWPLAPTITNMDQRLPTPPANQSTVVTSTSGSQHNRAVTREEPTFRVTPQPVPPAQPRRASIDVVSNTLPSTSLLLPAGFTLAAAAVNRSTDPNLSLPNWPSTGGMPAGGYAMKNAAQSSDSFDKQKRGYLTKAKISEGKKKVKKTWAQAYIVAFNDKLLIYKDEKMAASKEDAVYGKPEAVIDLQHAVVDWSSKERSTKKNVIEVVSASGTCYLLRHDDNILIHQWYTVILGKVRRYNRSVTSEDSPSVEPESNNNTDKSASILKLRKRAQRLSKSSFSKNKGNGAGKSVYTLHEDNEEFQSAGMFDPAGEVMKTTSIKEKLRSFLSRRPTQESLEKAGIIQAERVFGSHLQFVCDRELTTVPIFVVSCINAIEQKGLDYDGLYRINGNQAQIQKLRFAVDSSDDYNLADYDVHVLTGALKLFFRELKEPLIPFSLYDELSKIIRDKDKSQRTRSMKVQLATMPNPNLHTLRLLFAHLVRVLDHANENRMKRQSIAIVFGPTLMWPKKESSAIAVNMMCQNTIVEYILANFDRLL